MQQFFKHQQQKGPENRNSCYVRSSITSFPLKDHHDQNTRHRNNHHDKSISVDITAAYHSDLYLIYHVDCSEAVDNCSDPFTPRTRSSRSNGNARGSDNNGYSCHHARKSVPSLRVIPERNQSCLQKYLVFFVLKIILRLALMAHYYMEVGFNQFLS